MPTASFSSQENQLHDYKIMLTPIEDKWLSEVQMEDQDLNSATLRKTSFAEVTLVCFKQNEALEERILNRLGLIARANPPIKIDMKDFGFPETTTVFFVGSTTPITAFIQKLKEEAGTLMNPEKDNNSFFSEDNKVLQGKEMNAWQYTNGWMEISNENYKGSFIAYTMSLLKRKEGDFKFQLAADFEFLNLPEETKQGELF